MTGKPSLAVLGAKPRFREPLPVGQFYWPPWELYEKAARDIFSRRFYTSQRFAGPVVVELQRRLQEFLGVKHVVAVRNATNGLMIVAHTLGLRGKVIVPSWTHFSTVQSLIWSNCQPIFCDIDLGSQQMSSGATKRILEDGGVGGILGVHLWGNASPVLELETLAKEYDVPLYFDASHAFGCRVAERAIGTFGRAEVFSFHAANILNTAEGACIATNDDELASKFMTMRGDELSWTDVTMRSATTRMSEMQAAIGLLMLEEYEDNRRNNEEQSLLYERRLGTIPGIKTLKPSREMMSNFQSLVVIVEPSELGLTRDELLAVLHAENVVATRYFHRPNHTIKPFADVALNRLQLQNTELAAQRTFQLPIGARVTVEDIEHICNIIHEAYRLSRSLRSALPPLAFT